MAGAGARGVGPVGRGPVALRKVSSLNVIPLSSRTSSSQRRGKICFRVLVEPVFEAASETLLAKALRSLKDGLHYKSIPSPFLAESEQRRIID